jgi:[CysO sulfur-carrier protein]-S-L-cysteine hydrolase
MWCSNAGSAEKYSRCVRIAQDFLDEIVAHAREEAPNECCGLIAGADGRATRVHRARNEFSSPMRFNVHPQDLIRITTEIEDSGEELAGIYHSHPRSEAYPSQTDINLAANWPDPLWLICSLASSEPVVRAFSISEGQVEEVELDVR